MPHTHTKRNSDGPIPVTAGFTPGGHIPSGYSYLQRSHSLVTPSRRNLPKGLESPSIEKQVVIQSPRIAQSPKILHHSSSTNSLTESISSPRLNRLDAEVQTVAELVAQLPPNPKVWTSSQVALYLTHVLGLTPKPIVEDVTAYVRRSRMGGKVFLRLREKDLEAEGLNLKWRKLMIEAVKKLRRDCLRGRIWGFEGGLQLPRQEDDMLEDQNVEEEAMVVKNIPVTAKGTLKRLRDKKAIRGMIYNFENASQDGRDDEEGFVALGNRRRSRESLHSNDSSDHSIHREEMAPIYGKGFVKLRAESFTSLQDVEFKRKEITKEELEQLFGSLSAQEAEALANELQEDEELLQLTHEEHRLRNRSTSSDHSSVSGESGPFTPPALEKPGFDLTPLNPELVDAIVRESSDATEAQQESSATKSLFSIEPLRRDVLVSDEEDGYGYVPNHALSAIRPGSANGGRSNPYRSSTYEPEELEALGLHVGEDEDIKFGTARKISRPPSYEEEEQVDFDMLAAKDSIRVKRAMEANKPIKDVFSSTRSQESEPQVAHMRNMSAHEASGLSPYKPLSPAMSRKSSQRRQNEGEKSALAELVEGKVEEIKENNKATFGRKGGANSMQLTAMLKASGIVDGPDADVHSTDDGKKAEDESEWGITVSRKASRKGTLARNVVVGREKEGAASRMAELFSPAVPISELNADNLKELEEKGNTVTPSDHLYVPLTTLEATADGKGSIRKRSMVLVERKRFESLARRMGVLESQLADWEAASLPPLSDLGSLAQRNSVAKRTSSRALDEVFTIPQVPPHLFPDLDNEENEVKSVKGEGQSSSWSIPLLLGAIPSYALGLGAGVGFVLLSEVLGRSRP